MKNKKFGFTLAEVLITLAIIGVVAALTIPTLLANYNKREWATKLIKTRAELNQGFQMLLASEGNSSLSQTKPWALIKIGDAYPPACYITEMNTPPCNNFANLLLQYFPGSSLGTLADFGYKDGTSILGLNNTVIETIRGDKEVIKLKNGAILYTGGFYVNFQNANKEFAEKLGGKYLSQAGYFYVDINGSKGPNQYGRDFFDLSFSDDGFVHPKGGKSFALFNRGENYKTAIWNDEEVDDNIRCDSTGKGEGCAARVIETGKMDY